MTPTEMAAAYPDGTFCVYTARAADGAVLYIGKTKQLRGRIYTHRARSPWWGMVDALEVIACVDGLEMDATEVRLIAAHRPPFNQVNKNGAITLSTAGAKSSKRELIDLAMTGDLLPLVAEWRESGANWRAIADEVSQASGRQVSYESLRSWFTERQAVTA